MQLWLPDKWQDSTRVQQLQLSFDTLAEESSPNNNFSGVVPITLRLLTYSQSNLLGYLSTSTICVKELAISS